MKILHVLGWYLPDSVGGTELYVERLSQSLNAMGHEVSVAAPQSGIVKAHRYVHNGICVFRYPVPSRPNREEAEGRQPARGAKEFHHWLREARPDVVHFHSYTTGVGLHEMVEAKSIGAKVIVTNHLCSVGYVCQRGTMMRWGDLPCDGLAEPVKCSACAIQARGIPQSIATTLATASRYSSRLLPTLPGRVGTLLGMTQTIRWNQQRQSEMLTLADRFVLLNDWATRVASLNGAPAAKLELNRLGVPAHIKRKPAPDSAPTTLPIVVGYLGRIARMKGILELALAVREVRRHAPLRLEVWGPANDEEGRQLLRELERLNREDSRIRYEGAVDPEHVPTLLTRFDVLCCPSISFENGPTVALEAQAVGTPVVGSSAGAVQEIVRDGVDGRLAPPGDVKALGAILSEIANNPRDTIDKWRAAPPKVRTMTDVAADYDRTYRSLLNASERGAEITASR